MTPEEWQVVKDVFNKACELPHPAGHAFVREKLSGYPKLAEEVFRLLEADNMEHTAVDSFDSKIASLTGFSGLVLNLKIPDKIGPYTIQGEIDRGGMGIVLEGFDTRLERKVALKLLPFFAFKDSEARTRFIEEAKAASRNDHPNIVTIYEIDEDEQGFLYLAMPRYEGRTLREVFKDGPVDHEKAMDWLKQIADGLRAAHKSGVIHCDIKPSNLFLTTDNRIKILDFGIARYLSEDQGTGTSAGTIAYMSPEQLKGSSVGFETDIWSAGTTIFEAVTGSRPYNGKDRAEILDEIEAGNTGLRWEKVKNENTGLADILEKCLNSDPASRYRSAADLHADVVSLIEEQQTPSAGKEDNKSSDTAGIRFFLWTAAATLLAAFLMYLYLKPARVIEYSHIEPQSVAVMPFTNTTGSAELDYISEGLTESLINILQEEGSLYVPARESVFRLSAEMAGRPEIRTRLGVSYILEGTVFIENNDLYLETGLINSRTGNVIMADRHSLDSLTIPKAEREIADRTIFELTGKTHDSEGFGPSGSAEINPEAYADYLKGRYQWNKRTGQGIAGSIGFYNRAIEHDPGFAPAYAGLAQSYALSAWYSGKNPDDVYPHAREAALKALQLDPGMGAAHAALGSVYWQYERDLENAEKAFLKAIELNPNNVSALNWYGELLVYTGRFDEGIETLNRALRADPLSLITRVDAGTAYYLNRNYDRALEYYREALTIEPNFALAMLFSGMAYEAKGDIEKAVGAIEVAIETGGANQLWMASLARVYVLSGRVDEASRILADLEETSRSRFISPLALAMVYSAMGDETRAIEGVERAIEMSDPFLVFMNVHPQLDEIRQSPEFQDLVKIAWK